MQRNDRMQQSYVTRSSSSTISRRVRLPTSKEHGRPRVAVFDATIAPAIAFTRSLGNAGVDVTTLCNDSHAAARYSRYSRRFQKSPSAMAADRFVPWLRQVLRDGRFDLVAPTSDYVAWYTALSHECLAPAYQQRQTPPVGVSRTVFKDAFASAVEQTETPAPPTLLPLTIADARLAAHSLGYPLVMKPRSHLGVGVDRGIIVRNERELETAFVPFRMLEQSTLVQAQHPHVAMPLLQRYLEPSKYRLVSISGFLTPEGNLAAVTYAEKRSQWPPRLGIGTVFETIDEPPFAEGAVDAVRRVLGHGIFELEVMYDPQTGEKFALDLNPRGFGQMSLDIACGADLPLLWYRSVCGEDLEERLVSPAGRRWVQAVPYYIQAMVRLARGPQRLALGREYGAELLQTRVGVAHMWSDPLPGIMFGLHTLRHPRGIVRSYISDTEGVQDASTNDVG